MDSKDLQLVRLLLGLSREAFAYLLGCSNVQIYAMEAGRRTISPKYRAALLDIIRGRDFQERIARLRDLREELENEQQRGDDDDND